MTAALQLVVDALSVGSLYALSALGIGLIFGIMRLINFAHGEFIMVGAYAAMLTAAIWAPFAVIVAVAVALVVALVTERLAFRRLRSSPPATLLITSFAVSYLLQNLMVLIEGARPQTVDFLSALTRSMDVGGVRLPWINVVTIAVTAVLLTLLAIFLRRTRFGRMTRAAASDFRMARLLGVRADRVIAIAFALSGLLAAAVAILLLAQTGTVSPVMGLQLALVGFVATVIGGMGSLSGAVLGGLTVGAVTVLLQSLLPAELRPFRDAFVYGLVIAVLLVRPGGLFRSAAAMQERV